MSLPVSLPAVIAAPPASLVRQVPPGECPEEWYCRHPEAITQAFAAAKERGASLLLAPPQGATLPPSPNLGWKAP